MPVPVCLVCIFSSSVSACSDLGTRSTQGNTSTCGSPTPQVVTRKDPSERPVTGASPPADSDSDSDSTEPAEAKSEL
eukprot:3637391-Rhodomonas_salina.1